jgi:hypothetical protein
MEQEQKSNIGAIIFILAACGFAIPLSCLFIAFLFSSGFIPLNIKDYSNQIITVFAIYSIFHISYLFFLDKFYKKRKNKPLGIYFGILFKWFGFGLYFSYLGAIITILEGNMNYAYSGVLITLAISFYVINYIKVPVKIDEKDIQLKVWALISTMNLITGSAMICVPVFFPDLIEVEETIKPFFGGIIKYMGIFTSGFGLGILYVLFVLFRKNRDIEYGYE